MDLAQNRIKRAKHVNITIDNEGNIEAKHRLKLINDLQIFESVIQSPIETVVETKTDLFREF